MRIDVITIFPDYLQPLRHALLGKAIERGLVRVSIHDLRRWAHDVHKSVDDSPYGGGPGMVMKPTVWGDALDDVSSGHGHAAESVPLDSASAHVIARDDQDRFASTSYHHRDYRDDEDHSLPLLVVPTPAGRPFTQATAQAWSHEEHIVFACGRYEGIDSRVVVDARRRYRVREVSIGDYVLIGGEVAVLVITEAVVRLIPGVLGNSHSHEDDSFSDGLLEGPSYTRPQQWRGLAVPEVLMSGNHADIARWRRKQALLRTQQFRPELLNRVELTDDDRKTLGWSGDS